MFLVPEVEWDDVERAGIEALRWYRDEYLCPCGCGWPRSITLDPATEFALDVPQQPQVCMVTKRIAVAAKAWSKQDGADSAGLLWSVRLGGDGPGHEGDQG